MKIPNLVPGEPIDYYKLNTIIDRLNQLEDADNMKWVVRRGPGGVKYTTTDSKLLVQAVRNTRSLDRDDSGYHGSIGDIDFPEKFVSPPVVLVGFEGSYLLPHVSGVTSSGFKLSAMRVSQSWADIPKSVTFDYIAIGATKA